MKPILYRHALPAIAAAAAAAAVALTAAGLAPNHSTAPPGASVFGAGESHRAQSTPGRSRLASDITSRDENLRPSSESVPVVAELARDTDLVAYRSQSGRNCTALLSATPSQVSCADVGQNEIHFLGFGPRLERGSDGILHPTGPARSWGVAPDGTVAVRYRTADAVTEFPVFEGAGRGHTFFVNDYDATAVAAVTVDAIDASGAVIASSTKG